MGFEWIAAIGSKDESPPAGFERPNHLADRRAIILNVLKDLVAEDQVKRRGGQGQKFACAIDDMGGVFPRFRCSLEIVFQPEDGAAV